MSFKFEKIVAMNRFVQILIPVLLLSFNAVSSQGLFEQSLSQSDTLKNRLVHVNGFVRSSAYVSKSINNDSPYFQSLSNLFGLNADISAGTFGGAFAEFRIRSGNEFEKKFTEYELREVYGKIYFGPLEIRAGKQIHSWGASSFVNPSDQFSPINPTFRSPFQDDLRIGVWSLKTNLAINSRSGIHFLWIPDYEHSELLTEPFAFPGYIEFGEDKMPGVDLNEGSFGLLYDSRTRFFDLQLSLFHGYRNTPSIISDSVGFNYVSLEPELIRLVKTAYKINSVGFNLTVPLGSYLLRTEAGWLNPMKDQDYATPFSEISYTAEIEQSGEMVTVIGGYYGKKILDYSKPATTPAGIMDPFPDVSSILPAAAPLGPETINEFVMEQIGSFNRLYNYQNKEYYHSAYLSISMSLFHSLLDLEIPLMYDFTTEELTLMPSLKIDITDGLSIQMGAYYLQGGESSLYEMVGPILNAGYGLLQVTF